MSLELTFDLRMPLRLYQLAEIAEAQATLRKTKGQGYTWKASGQNNWLEKGFSLSDALGLVVLPKGLPELIELPDDTPAA